MKLLIPLGLLFAIGLVCCFCGGWTLHDAFDPRYEWDDHFAFAGVAGVLLGVGALLVYGCVNTLIILSSSGSAF